jgi:hypothetical protein
MKEYFHKARIFTENYYFYALEHVIQDSTFVSPCGCQFDLQRKVRILASVWRQEQVPLGL